MDSRDKKWSTSNVETGLTSTVDGGGGVENRVYNQITPMILNNMQWIRNLQN